jgi:hypothetical protein
MIACAGKSTVREVIGSDSLWSKIGSTAVVIEADAIKNQDVVLQVNYLPVLAASMSCTC